MKKFFLSAFFAVACVLTSQANTFTFINLSACVYTYHVAGVDPANPNLVFASNPVNVPPGNTVFNQPSDLPGLPSLPATVYYYFVRGWVNASPVSYSANVGNFPTQGFPTSNTVPALPCNSNNGNTITWNGNSTGGNVVVLIF